MTKNQLIEILSRKAHLTKKAAREAVETFLEEIKKTLQKGDKVVLSGFGTFHVTPVSDKPVLIPRTKQKIIVKAHRKASFIAGKTLKKLVK